MAAPARPFWHALLPGGAPPRADDCAGGFPDHVDVLVIGCGMTGASAAYHLAQQQRERLGEGGEASVLVVDARRLADGATGRNGGHQWAEVAEKSDAEGQKHARVEAADIKAVEEFARSLDAEDRAELQLERTGGVHFSMDEKEAPFLQDFADNTAQTFLNDEEMRSQGVVSPACGEKHLSGVVVPGAGQLVPGRLVLALVKQARARGVRVQTECKVTAIEKAPTGDGWRVHVRAPRGDAVFEAKKIVHASNAYGHDLLPKRLQAFCRGVRGQCIGVQVDEDAGRGPVIAPRSLTFKSCEGSHEEYLIQRVADDKTIIFGGCRHAATDEGEPFAHEGEPEEKVSQALLDGLKRFFPDRKFHVRHAWTGLMCFTKDSRPLVGPLREWPGQFVALGFGGHGMVRTFTSGRAIASLLQHGEGAGAALDSNADRELLDLFAVDRVGGQAEDETS